MKLLALFLFSCLFVITSANGQNHIEAKYAPEPVKSIEPNHLSNMLLWYKSPAKEWVEALPIGNGRFGAMIYGDPRNERLQMNEITMWSGNPQPDADRKDGYKYLDTIRKTIRHADYKSAEDLVNKYFTSSAPYNSSFQTLGDINFNFHLPEGDVADYNRWLDIDKAVSGVNFAVGEVKFSREIFSSAPDQVMVEALNSSCKGALSFEVALSRVERATTRSERNNKLIMTGSTGNALRFEVQLVVINDGGTVTVKDNKIIVDHADNATVLVTAATSFLLDYRKNFAGPDPHLRAQEKMKLATRASYSYLKSRHITEYQRYFHRVKLELGGSSVIHLPTDERLKAYGDGFSDPAFAALFYQYGRYLLISSSRPDNPLPSNAQGLWGDGLDLPWKCDYKSNINFQMNYWPAEEANLTEMHIPMLRLINNLVTPGKKTAQAYYGPKTPGWYYGYTTNGWLWTSPGATLVWGVFAGGSGWSCQHLWEHYAYTRGLNYLRSIYPTLKGAAEFYLATMVRDENGFLVTSPSTSPENNFITDKGIKGSVTQGTTIEKSIVWDLFDNVAKACAALHLDADFRKRLLQARDSISPLKIGRAGQLMEWNGDWDLNSDDMHHRHVSHLFAMHPGHQITFFGTPALAAAVKKSLELRGDNGTGWSLAWKENLWARLHDGDHAYRLLSNQLKYTKETKIIMADAGGTYPNLFDAHPPFQIDGNFGAVSAISQFLLQSSEQNTDEGKKSTYLLDILPALPFAWSRGSVTGLRGIGNFLVSLQWDNHKLNQMILTSQSGGKCIIQTPIAMKLNRKATKWDSEKKQYVISINTVKGMSYKLSPI